MYQKCIAINGIKWKIMERNGKEWKHIIASITRCWIKKSPYFNNLKYRHNFMVEVRGVEPLSAKQSRQVATCLVYQLILFCCTLTDTLTSEPVSINLNIKSTHP